MLYRLSISLPAVLLAACANGPSEVPPAASSDVAATIAAAGAETVDITELDNGRVCERVVPTGSRIAEQWCYTREEYDARQAAMHDDIQRDMAELRRQQEVRRMAEEDARQAMRRGTN